MGISARAFEVLSRKLFYLHTYKRNNSSAEDTIFQYPCFVFDKNKTLDLQSETYN